MAQDHQSLTQAEKEAVFRSATGALTRWYGDEIKAGMTDVELTQALKVALGIFGGSCGPGRLSVTHKASGLTIWGGWHIINHLMEEPLFKGQQTLAMARYLYNIANPDDQQLALL